MPNYNAEAGARTKCTRPVRAKVAEALRKGHTRKEAAIVAGICPQTFCRWYAAGSEHPPKKLCYRLFREAVDLAEAEGAGVALRVVSEVMAEGTGSERLKAAEMMLKLRWGRSEKQALELSGPGGGPVEVHVDPVEAIRRLAPGGEP
jgi:hypothetical protein